MGGRKIGSNSPYLQTCISSGIDDIHEECDVNPHLVAEKMLNKCAIFAPYVSFLLTCFQNIELAP